MSLLISVVHHRAEEGPWPFGSVYFRKNGARGFYRHSGRTQLNPLFKVHRAVEVPSLPRTASNKVMRRVLRDQLRGEDAPRARL